MFGLIGKHRPTDLKKNSERAQFAIAMNALLQKGLIPQCRKSNDANQCWPKLHCGSVSAL